MFDLQRRSHAPHPLPSVLSGDVANPVSAGFSIASARAPINQPDSFDQIAAETAHADGMARLAQPECDALVESSRPHKHALASNTENNDGRVSVDQLTLLKVSVSPHLYRYVHIDPRAGGEA